MYKYWALLLHLWIVKLVGSARLCFYCYWPTSTRVFRFGDYLCLLFVGWRVGFESVALSSDVQSMMFGDGHMGFKIQMCCVFIGADRRACVMP